MSSKRKRGSLSALLAAAMTWLFLESTCPMSKTSLSFNLFEPAGVVRPNAYQNGRRTSLVGSTRSADFAAPAEVQRSSSVVALAAATDRAERKRAREERRERKQAEKLQTKDTVAVAKAEDSVAVDRGNRLEIEIAAEQRERKKKKKAQEKTWKEEDARAEEEEKKFKLPEIPDSGTLLQGGLYAAVAAALIGIVIFFISILNTSYAPRQVSDVFPDQPVIDKQGLAPANRIDADKISDDEFCWVGIGTRGKRTCYIYYPWILFKEQIVEANRASGTNTLKASTTALTAPMK